MPKAPAVAQGYVAVAVAIAVLIMPVPNLLLAAVPIGGLAYRSFRPVAAGAGVWLCLTSVLIVPLLLDPALGAWSGLLVAPALPWLHRELERLASEHAASPLTSDLEAQGLSGPGSTRPGRQLTPIAQSMALALLLIGVVSGLAGNFSLLAATALVGAYLAGLAVYALLSAPRAPVEAARQRARVVAGKSQEVALGLTNRGRLPLRLRLVAEYPWVRIAQPLLQLEREASVTLSLTPPLSGPSRPALWVDAIDPRGLVCWRQALQPVELHVIPRARYAAWLAKKYLEQFGAGAAIVTGYDSSTKASQRGLEYLGSRPYQPGDRLRDVDWRHTFKLNEMVIKERAEIPGNSAVIVLNLAVRDAEEADRLAHDLITGALTLAKEGVPTALVAYDHARVVEVVSPPGDPWTVLRTALKLSQNIVQIPGWERFLQTPDFSRLRRALGQLERAESEPAQRLYAMLGLELRAWQNAAKGHPVTRALESVTGPGSQGAAVSVLSMRNHDAGVLDMCLDKLVRQGYRIVTLAPGHAAAPAR